MKQFLWLAPFMFLCACNSRNAVFSNIDPDKSGIHFNNEIPESDSVNVLVFENVYNGGGVGVGDFNQDGLQDIYFTGNLVPNKLYLNKGEFKFQDITRESGTDGAGRWGRGVSVIDINNDGLLDLYVCASVKDNPVDRQNLLYVNKGTDNQGIPHFDEKAAEYGLNDTTHSTMAAFFDYDRDGDLDVYIVVNDIIKGDYPNRFRHRMINGEHPSTGRLYRNDWNDTLRHGVFHNVSREAGMLIEGYGHSVNVTDINRDGWPDLYVTNDYLSNNILYINNHDGTFTDRVTEYFKHTSANAMGSDVTDINNDGLVDVVELDMNPEDNYRKKMMMNANSYQTYQNIEYYKYQYQYVRNTLQLNLGPRVLANDSLGAPEFGDIAYYAGISETDWSWTPLVNDFDNDGYRDIIVTNGFPKDVTDHDFITFRNSAYLVATKKQLLDQIPAVKIPNYAFRNDGNLHFTDVSKDWGFNTPSFTNGAAYADLDNDGDLDVVMNNINDVAQVYRNNVRSSGKDESVNNFFRVSLKGDSLNKNGFGAWLEIYYGANKQVYEQQSCRGYLSSIDLDPHFGVGNATRIDSLTITWPDGRYQKLTNLPVNKTQVLDIKNALKSSAPVAVPERSMLFSDITAAKGIRLMHKERDYIDFNIQKLLPHKLSEYGPGMAAGDVDGNGLDDIIIGGSYFFRPQMLLQQADGNFEKRVIGGVSDSALEKRSEDMGLLLVDVDNDKDLDLYVASGSVEGERNSPSFADHLFINDGKANFTEVAGALPANYVSKSCVRAVDYDNDGDLDLFVAGRVDPGFYPKPVSSFIYRNDSKPGAPKFTDVSASIAPSLKEIGLVCDALFSDIDNDGWPDLLLAGEWMPLTILKNQQGRFENITSQSGLSSAVGWWNSLSPGDFDNDGDIDFVAGNLGKNSFYKASDKYPISIIAKDFDNNGSYDAIPALYLKQSIGDSEKKNFPANTRDDLVKQMISMRSKFQNFKTYAITPIDKIFTEEQLKGALKLQANYLSSAYIENTGNGKFAIHELPGLAQMSAIDGMVTEDFDGDGNLDVLLNTNDYGTDVTVGRYDALNGLYLKGDGKGGFTAENMKQSGLYIPGNGKSLVTLRSSDGHLLVAASQNRGPLKLFRLNRPVQLISLQGNERLIQIGLKNGKTRRAELYHGAGFLSQSVPFLLWNAAVTKVDITDNTGQKKALKP